jgi:hypothetical protein
MITIDLFEQTEPQEPKRDPVQDPRVAMDQKTRQLALMIYDQMVKAYKSGKPISTITYPDPGVDAVTLSRNQLYTFLLHWAKAQQKGGKRKEDFIKLFGNRGAMLDYIGAIKKIEKAPAPPPIPEPEGILPGAEGPVQAVQGRLFKEAEKKSSEQSKYKDVAVQRAVRKAEADFPAAASDTEAFIKSMMVQQDQDQGNIDRLKSSYQRNRELINKNNKLDQDQGRNIDAIQQEINQVERDNVSLARMIQSMNRANAELKSTLDKMREKKPATPQTQPAVGAISVSAPAPAPQPQLGVSVATDKEPQPATVRTVRSTKPRRRSEPLATTKVGGQDAQVLTPRGGGRAPQKQAVRVDKAKRPQQITKPESDIDLDRILSQQDLETMTSFDSDIMSLLKGAREKVSEVQDIPFGMTEQEVRKIPAKMVVQGYNVEYDPVKQVVTVSRGGQLVGRAPNKPGSYSNYQLVANRIIDTSEQDKYPDDLEVRSVKENTEDLTSQDILFRTAAKAMYDAGQQGVDLDYEEAIRIASRLMRIPYAPSQIPALQSQLADVKKKIATLKSVRKNQRQREREKLTHQTTADEERRRQEWMKNYGDSLRRRLQTRQTESEQKKPSQAYEQGGREAYYGRPNSNPYKSGTQEHADYNRGYKEFKDEGKDYLRELDLDRSGQPMYQAQEVYMLTHNGREVAFYKLKDLKRAEQDAHDMQRKLGGEVHLRKVMREGEQQPQDDVMKRLFKDFGDIFGKQPPQPQKSEPEKKEVKEMGRAGYNAMNTEKDWHEVERYLSQMINDPSLDPETKKAYRQRYLEKRKEAQQKGWAK